MSIKIDNQIKTFIQPYATAMTGFQLTSKYGNNLAIGVRGHRGAHTIRLISKSLIRTASRQC